MATTVAGVAMASGGFVLKSVSAGKITRGTTLSVQNEGDFCVIENDFGSGSDKSFAFKVSQIDDIPVNITTQQASFIFGKNIVINEGQYGIPYHLYEYGPAE